MHDPLAAHATLETKAGPVRFVRLAALDEAGLGDVSRLPVSIRILLEAVVRGIDGFAVTEGHAAALAGWDGGGGADEVPFMPARVILQDFTGVPAVVDLAALRSAMARNGADPAAINPRVPCDLVIDHSVQVDAFGSMAALFINAEREFERNRERYEFLHWGQQALENFRVVPPASGIVHQVNLEYLATVVARRGEDGAAIAFPDSLVGTDSHTTMINSLGVLGWGVGGIEAEAVMLGQPIYMLAPEVVGFELTGRLPDGSTATDLVLTATEMLREHGVVGKFVEYFGDGLGALSLPDRATLANMAPEYGATMGFFPVDEETLGYLRGTGREPALVDLVERYTKEQGLFRRDGAEPAHYTETLELDMGTVRPSLAGPRRPQDRIPLSDAKRRFWEGMSSSFGRQLEVESAVASAVPWLGGTAGEAGEQVDRRRDLFAPSRVPITIEGDETHLSHGAVVIAAITSCTNTSNPSVMVGAGLLAKKAVEMGLDRRPWVKTSMAPGSRVVTRYLEVAGLLPYLQALGFHVVGYGCTTCIGNSGPLPEEVADAVADNDLVVASVLSGNRNFEGRINPHVRANYLASPPLVVAYALAGTMDIDLAVEPLGHDPNGRPVYLADLWPSQEEIRGTVASCLDPDIFRAEYANIFRGNEAWNAIDSGGGTLYDWRPESTYVREPPFFLDVTAEEPAIESIHGARVLAVLGDSVTTDHISPAGAIARDSAAGDYLVERGVEVRDFNSYGSRRGNHEVMMRGTFGNIRLRNAMVPDSEGPVTRRLPGSETMRIYDAAMEYRDAAVPLIILAGAEYGTGSSRDWAAKGPDLLGVRAVIAQSYERIHRSNLIGMGVLPLEFLAGDGAASLGLNGEEVYDIEVPVDLAPRQRLTVKATAPDGRATSFETVARVDSPVEVHYLRNGGILHAVLRERLKDQPETA